MANGLTRRERLRRVALLCVHFTRNLAYYRVGFPKLDEDSSEFWKTVNSNFIDVATLEWCKLFGLPRDKHHWQEVVSDASCFKIELLAALKISEADFSAYVEEMREYRDKFLAHLDDDRVAKIPLLEKAQELVGFYHRHIVRNEADTDDMSNLPADLKRYYDDCVREASSIYDRL